MERWKKQTPSKSCYFGKVKKTPSSSPFSNITQCHANAMPCINDKQETPTSFFFVCLQKKKRKENTRKNNIITESSSKRCSTPIGKGTFRLHLWTRTLARCKSCWNFKIPNPQCLGKRGRNPHTGQNATYLCWLFKTRRENKTKKKGGWKKGAEGMKRPLSSFPQRNYPRRPLDG